MVFSLSVVHEVIRGIRLDTNAHSARRDTGVRNELFHFCTLPLLISILLFANISYAQPELRWMRTYGEELVGDRCYDHIQTSDGGYALVGSSRPHFDNIWLVKTDGNGDLIWSTMYNTGNWDYARKIIEMDDGFLIFGSTGITDERYVRRHKAYTMNVNQDGDSLWTKTFGGEYADDINTAIRTADGGFALAGYTDSWGNGNYDIYLLRLDENCDSLWMRTYGGRGDDICEDIIQTSDGGFALAGRTNSARNGPESFLVIFTDDNGDSLDSFMASSGRFNHDFCYTILELREELYIISGQSHPPGVNYDYMWTMGINRDCEVLWSRFDGCIEEDNLSGKGYCSYKTGDNKVVLSGYFTDRIGLLKMDLEGHLEFERYWDSREMVYCYSILQTREGSYSLAGYCGIDSTIDNRVRQLRDYFLLLTEPDSAAAVDNIVDWGLVTDITLYPAFPNPFNDYTNINYLLPLETKGQITIYDPAGKVISQHYLEEGNRNRQFFTWRPSRLPSGNYFVTFRSGRQIYTRSIILLR